MQVRLQQLLRALVALLALAGLAAAFLLTLGFDEAWILQGVNSLARSDLLARPVTPVVSSGGAYAAIHAIVALAFGNSLLAHRLVSLVALFGCCLLLASCTRQADRSRTQAWILVGMFLGCAGTVLLGATAHACSLAFLLLLAGLRAWDASGTRGRRWLASGVLLGTCVATRLEFVVVFPALLIWALAHAPNRRERTSDALLVCVIGGLSAGMLVLGLTSLAPAGDPLDASAVAAAGAGPGGVLDYPRILNRIDIAAGLLPPWILVLVSLASVFALVREREARAQAGECAQSGVFWRSSPVGDEPAAIGVLLPYAWLGLALWLARAPIPHLRYLWGAMAAASVVGGLAICQAMSLGPRGQEGWSKNALLLLPIAFCATGLLVALRGIVHGESNILSWEWSREVGQDYFRRFQHAVDQRKAAEYVSSNVGVAEELGVVGLCRELQYLSGRKVVALEDYAAEGAWEDARLPRRLLIPPMAGDYLQLKPACWTWVAENCTLEAQFGRYSFYRVVGPYPSDPGVLQPVVSRPPVHPLSVQTTGTSRVD